MMDEYYASCEIEIEEKLNFELFYPFLEYKNGPKIWPPVWTMSYMHLKLLLMDL